MGKKSIVHDDKEKSNTSEYEPTNQEESEPLHTDDELVESSDEDELISTIRDRIKKKKEQEESSTAARKRKAKGKAKKDEEKDIPKASSGRDFSNRTRTINSPSKFCEVLNQLPAEQIRWIRGFHELLNFSIKELPHRLGFQLLKSFDEDKCVLNLECGEIPITEEDVHLVLGLPKGTLPIELETDEDSQAEKEKPFRAQFGKSHVRTSDLVSEIKKGTADDHFKTNFLVLMGNTLIQTVSNGLVDQRLVRFKGDINRCNVYNWCSYILQSLKTCKKEWAKDPATKYFCGPLVFLIRTWLLSWLKVEFDAANRQFNKCLKSCIDYNTVNKNEEFQTRVEAAQVFVCTEPEQFENPSGQPEKETEETSQHNSEPLAIPVEETIGTTNSQFDTSIQQTKQKPQRLMTRFLKKEKLKEKNKLRKKDE
uniref:Aminotransferase-like plant mobile domain-containing protein n=1 Tax=Daucus carota subsp. sativus TaxID=79200 RepID=A0A166CSA2_DAUCS